MKYIFFQPKYPFKSSAYEMFFPEHKPYLPCSQQPSNPI